MTTVHDRLHDRRNSFDILRVVAAWLVLYSHSYHLLGRGSDPWHKFFGHSDFGSLALSVFFIISGLLVSRSYLNDPHPARFLRRRALRIMPGLIVCVVLSMALLGPAVTTLTTREYFASPVTWAYLANCSMYRMEYLLPGVFQSHPNQAVNGSLWSLRVEFTMYMMVIVFGLLRLLKPLWVALALLVVLIFDWKIAGVLVPRDRGIVALLTGGQIAMVGHFLAGALINTAGKWIRLDPRLFVTCLAVLLVSGHQPWAQLAYLTTLPYIVVFIGLLKLPSWLELSRYGDLSYGIYIYAFPFQQLVLTVLGPSTSLWLFVLAATVPVFCAAAVSWRVIERPCLRLKGGQKTRLSSKSQNTGDETAPAVQTVQLGAKLL